MVKCSKPLKGGTIPLDGHFYFCDMTDVCLRYEGGPWGLAGKMRNIHICTADRRLVRYRNLLASLRMFKSSTRMQEGEIIGDEDINLLPPQK
jgi:hypothetical protein